MLLIDWFDRGFARNPAGAVLKSAATGTAVSYQDAAALTHRVAAALMEEGVGPGTPVAVLSPNEPAAFLALLGLLRCNASWVPLNQRSRPNELALLLRKTACRVLIYHERVADLAADVLAEAPDVRRAIAIGAGRQGDARFEHWIAADGVRVPRPLHEPDRPAVLIGTGGTTGEPKAVPVTHRMLEAMTLAMTTHMPQPDHPVLAVAAPMTHAAGIIAWPTLAQGGTLLVHDGVQAEPLLASIGQCQVTSLFLPPTAIYTLLAHPRVREFDYSSLRHFIYAAAPMSVEKLREALDVFGPVMCQTFGQAEAPMIATCLTPDEHVEAMEKPGREHLLRSVGRPSIVADVAILDEDGREMPRGEVGEIAVRGSLVMGGYLGDEEESARVRRPGGWHGTSDMGFMDDEGYVYVVDRARDMIISGGFNVWPSEIEQVVHGLAPVRDCAVIGIPDATWGEAVTAVVELHGDAMITEAEIIDTCRSQLGPVKAPKRVVFRELPRSAVGKVLKRQLRDEYWAEADRRV